MSRREFVAASGMGVAALAFGVGALTEKAEAQPRFSDYPYGLGVASGDQLPDSVVIWTRLAPVPLDSFGGMTTRKKVPVKWEVATDEGFKDVVQKGSDFAYPEYVHAVHVNVQGLRPASEYYYRFKAGSEISPVGRTKTAPAPGARVDAFAFAFASCQNYPIGYYNSYQRMAEEDLDAVVFLGDYIYEGGSQGSLGRNHEPARELFSLDDYRIRTAQYKTDPDLQRAHALFPWISTWDDHEVDNNYADENSENFPEESQEEFLVRRANAYRSYWEHSPLRPMRMPQGPDLPLYRRFTFGDLLDFYVLDNRQHRSDQVGEPDRFDPARTMLGSEQASWLREALAGPTARWNALAQSVFFSQLDLDEGPGTNYNGDAWDGYANERDGLRDHLAAAGTSNPVVLTGDVHASYVCDVKADFDDPGSATVATEFVGTSISSGGDGRDQGPRDGLQLADNPHIKFINRNRGYVRNVVTPTEWTADYRVVDVVTSPGSPVRTRASFVVEDGVPGAQRA